MDILNLDNWELKEVTEGDDTYTIKAEYTCQPDICPRCRTIKPKYSRYGTKGVRYQDMPIRAKHAVLIAERQRFVCGACGKTFFQDLPDIAEGYKVTQRLLSYIETACYKKTFSSISSEIGLTDTTIRSIFNKHLESQEKEYRFVTPEILGIDEVHLLKKPRCVMSNIKVATVYDILPNRNKDTVIKRLSSIPDKAKIQLVCMDMWKPYKDASRTVLPHAHIIIDKFHVVRLANVAMETIRKGLRQTLNKRQQVTLKNDRYLLRKRNKDLKPEQQLILETWIKNYPDLGHAYALKEGFYGIWDSRNKLEAKERYKEWKANIPNTMTGAFFPVVSAVANWEHEIFNYFHYPYTNAYTEALNGIIKTENRKGRGYSFPVIRGKLLYDPELHKKREKPQRVDRVAEGSFGYSFGCQLKPAKTYELLGVDISTLIEKIKREGL